MTSAGPKLRAQFDFMARVPNELTFKEGDILILIEKHESGMWKGELDGKIGLFPYNFVAEITDEDGGGEGGGQIEQQQILTEGWLTKQGHVRKNWKRRYFKIQGNTIYYYPKQDATKEAGTIPLSGCSVTTADTETGKPFSFHIFYPGNPSAKEFYICADNALDMTGWINGIEKSAK
ncbi:hypothetical protein BLNAU_15562 [Blattamonas nauphoetae]|uniref:PH domain-containing protein n=1 Tax=Blattamonas nauphoetae TaxID=2049346 RepID=A0ABQ9XCR3_9EUKA|nr:hypothetical protein BLNAU_15562 [Blattamonas nauphoetae]